MSIHNLPLILLLLIYKRSSSYLFRHGLLVRPASSLHAIITKRTAIWDGSEFQSLDQYYHKHIDPLQHEDMKTFKNTLRMGFSTVVAGTLIGTNERVVGILKHNHAQVMQINSQGGQIQDCVQVDTDSFIYRDSMAFIPMGVTDDEAIQTLVASLVGVHCAFNPTILANVGGSLDNVAENVVGRTAVILGGGELASFISEYVQTIMVC